MRELGDELQPFSGLDWIGDADNLRANTGGLDKRYPQGPVCTFKGIDVPTFCCCTENGSITGELLADMLSVMDKKNLFDRSDGVAPFLLLDGHNSRFDLKFLTYVNDPATKWNACIGVPYGTCYWQVGDSSEQNGCFKMALTRYKRELLRQKELVNSEFAVKKKDIAYLVAQAWEDSFARVRQNKTAIAERGWGPLNYYCLLHPEIIATRHHNVANNDNNRRKESNNTSDHHLSQQVGEPDSSFAEQLNLSKGLSGSLIGTILDTVRREDARNGINRDEIRRKQVEKLQQIIDSKSKRYSAGIHVGANRYLLGPDTRDNIEARHRNQLNKLSERQEKKLQEFRSLRAKVTAIRELQKESEQLNVLQLKVMVTWYRRAGDLPTPSRRNLLIERLNSTQCRSDPVEPTAPAAHFDASMQKETEHSTNVFNNVPANYAVEAADEIREPPNEV